jgi:hypothetical protein
MTQSIRPAPQSWDLLTRKDVSAGPDDSSAWLFAPSFARARIGAGRYSGFQAFSVGSHHFVGALDVDRLGGENSLSNSLVRSGGDRPTVVLAAPRHQHEDDARDLVGERHRGQIELVFDRLALEHPARP